MKKIIILVLSIIILSQTFCFTNVSFAQSDTTSGANAGSSDSEPPPSDTYTPDAGFESLKDAKFDLGVLQLPDPDSENDNQVQPLAYFNDTRYDSPIIAFIASIINFLTAIIGSIAVILFIAAGFMFMFSQGNQQKLDEAKDIVKYAVLGLVVTFLSYIVIISIQTIFSR